MTIKSDFNEVKSSKLPYKETDNLFNLFLHCFRYTNWSFVFIAIFIVGLILMYLGNGENNAIIPLLITAPIIAFYNIAIQTHNQIESQLRTKEKIYKPKSEVFSEPLYDDEDMYDYSGKNHW